MQCPQPIEAHAAPNFPGEIPSRGCRSVQCRGLSKLYPAWIGGDQTTTGSKNPSDSWPQAHSVYDGVIVRCPWKWLSTDSSGNQLGEMVADTQGLVKFAQITDGTSKTMLSPRHTCAATATRLPIPDTTPMTVVGTTVGTLTRCVWPVFRRSATAIPLAGRRLTVWIPISATSAKILAVGFNVYHFGSAHERQSMPAFSDGSVHGISLDIDPVIFNNLAARNDGQNIDLTSIN